MSVSLELAAKQHNAPPVARFPAAPWTAPAGSEASSGLELSGNRLHFAPDREIYAEGGEAQCFYKVTSGVARTCRFLSDGRRQIDAFHVPGDLFGFEAGPLHQLAAEAVSDCVVMAYRRRGLEAMIAQDDRLGSWFFAQTLNAIARLREHAMLLARASAPRKVATFLLALAAHDSMIELPMSRQDIADYLGLTIETVSRTLSQLERDGIIGLPAARRIIVKNRPALLDISA